MLVFRVIYHTVNNLKKITKHSKTKIDKFSVDAVDELVWLIDVFEV